MRIYHRATACLPPPPNQQAYSFEDRSFCAYFKLWPPMISALPSLVDCSAACSGYRERKIQEKEDTTQRKRPLKHTKKKRKRQQLRMAMHDTWKIKKKKQKQTNVKNEIGLNQWFLTRSVRISRGARNVSRGCEVRS